MISYYLQLQGYPIYRLMPIPGTAEPGDFSGQQQVQQHPSISFSSAIPIKKRRFPIIRSPTPSPEEKISGSEDHGSQNKRESKTPDEERSYLIDAKNTISPGNSDVSKTSTSVVKKEFTPSNFELGRANVGIFASRPQEAKPTVSLTLNPVAVLGNKLDILLKEKSSDHEVKGSEIANVKQEILGGQTEDTCGLELSTDSMSVELSLGPKESMVPSLEHKKIEAICHRSDKSDPSLLSLALRDEKFVQLENDSTVDDVGSGVCTSRSNWDLNTNMDVWEGSANSDAFSHNFADIVGGFGKMDSCLDEKSSLTTTGTVDLSLNKGKHILDVRSSSSSNATIRPNQQFNTDVSLGLRLAMPHRELDARKEHFFLSDNLVSAGASRNLGSQQVQLSAMNVNRTLKSEPVDKNSRRDCSVGSSSSNMGLLKLSFVETGFVNNHSLETVLQSSVSPDKLVNCSISMKSEVVQKACKYEDGTLPQSVARLMQHQESCASSSSLLVPLMPQSSCSLIRLPTFSELMPSGNLSSHLENSFHSEVLHDRNDIPGEQIGSVVSEPVSQDDKKLRPCSIGNSRVVDPDKHKLAKVDEDMVELCLNGEEAADDEEKINIPAIEEESFESYCEPRGDHVVDPSMDIGENIHDKGDEEYEDGEVREPLQCSARDEWVDVGKKTENLELIWCDSRDSQPSDLSGDQDISTSDFAGKDYVKKNREETYIDPNKHRISISCMLDSDDNSLQKVSDKVLEVGVDEKKTVSVSPDKRFDLSEKIDIEESPGKEISSDRPINVNCSEIGVEIEDAITDKVIKEICSGENNSTLSKLEASLKDHDAAKDSSNAGNNSRIINLSSASFLTSPCKTKSIPNRLLTTRIGKERYSDLDGEIQSRGNRDEIYTGGGGSNQFAKDRAHDQSLWKSRASFMLGRGRISGHYGSFRGEWDSDHDFPSGTSYGPSDYRAVRRKHASDVVVECNDYDIQQDGTALGSNNRRRPMNDEFRHTSLRRFFPGDRDGPANRGNQTFRRFPRNMNPNRSNGEDAIGLRHADKFMRHLSDDIINPIYNHPPQAMYDELDEHLERGNRNFFTMQRKGYPRNHSKSPVRSRTRSPGPWSSPQHRSRALCNRMGRMRSPDRACFRNEMVFRRHGSPNVARHLNDLRDVDSVREHVHHPRSASANSNRRSSPERVFPRSGRRTDALDSDGDEYMNKFHELRSDGSIDERRKFVERRGPGPIRSFRPSYHRDGENFHFHSNDGPRPPYRFCPDGDMDFVERGNMREREFDERMKHHQPLVVSRRVRNVEQQLDGNYRPVERVWHDDGFNDGRVKRRRF